MTTREEGLVARNRKADNLNALKRWAFFDCTNRPRGCYREFRQKLVEAINKVGELRRHEPVFQAPYAQLNNSQCNDSKLIQAFSGQVAHPTELLTMLLSKRVDEFQVFHRSSEHIKAFEQHRFVAGSDVKVAG